MEYIINPIHDTHVSNDNEDDYFHDPKHDNQSKTIDELKNGDLFWMPVSYYDRESHQTMMENRMYMKVPLLPEKKFKDENPKYNVGVIPITTKPNKNPHIGMYETEFQTNEHQTCYTKPDKYNVINSFEMPDKVDVQENDPELMFKAIKQHQQMIQNYQTPHHNLGLSDTHSQLVYYDDSSFKNVIHERRDAKIIPLRPSDFDKNIPSDIREQFYPNTSIKQAQALLACPKGKRSPDFVHAVENNDFKQADLLQHPKKIHHPHHTYRHLNDGPEI